MSHDLHDLSEADLVEIFPGRGDQNHYRAIDRLDAALRFRFKSIDRPFLRRRGRRRANRRQPADVPRGWICERLPDRDGWILGPWWAMLDYVAIDLYCAACALAIAVGAAREPYEGCYYTELEWWPRGPRVPGGRS